MASTREPSSVISELRNTPGALIALLGFGIFLLSMEATRLPAIQTVNANEEYGSLSSVVSLLVIVVLLLIFRRRFDTLVLRSLFVAGMGVLMSASLFFVFGQSIFPESTLIHLISNMVFSVCEAVLFFCWIKTLYPMGAKTLTIVFAFSLITLAALSGLTALFRIEAAHGMVTMLPILSAACLCYYRDYVSAHGSDRSDPSSEVRLPIDDSLFIPLDDTRRGYLVFLTTLGASLFCYAFVFGYIHFQWVQLQDGGFLSLAMQFGIALGAACAGFFVLLVARFLWSRRNIELFKTFLVPTIILAIWLSTFVDEAWIVFYLILLNVTQKMVFLFFMVLAPFIIKSKKAVLWPWCVAYISFAGGRAVSALLVEFGLTEVFSVLSVIALGVLITCVAISTLMNDSTDEKLSDTTQRGDLLQMEVPYSHGHKFQKACRYLSTQNQLTQREEEILVLLARGRTAQHIAEQLVITQSTAKTHLRNIYVKMGVHNQQEIINQVEKTLEDQRPAGQGGANSGESEPPVEH